MSLFGFLERRSIENPAVPLTDTGLLSLLAGPPTEAGVPVTEYTAMNFSAVYRCVALISGLGGALPIVTYRKGTKERVEDPLVDDPHPDMTPVEFWRLTYVHRALWGNFYAQKLRTRGGKLQYLMPLLPIQVLPQRVPASESNPSGKVFKVTDNAGKSSIMTSEDIFHLPGLGFDGIAGTSPVKLAAQGIGLALGAERYAAKLFGSGNLTSGILTTDQKLTEDQAKGLKGRWRETTSGLRNAHEATIMDAGLKWQSLSMPNDDAQLLESRRFELTELGRYFGVPPFLLFDHEKSTTWGCLPGDSLVFTTSGPKPIENVTPGDEVWSFSDDQGIVTGKVTAWKMTGYKPLLTIRTQSRDLRLTGNHVVPVRRRFGRAEGRASGNCAWETVEVRADQVKAGDYLLVPSGVPAGDRTTAPNGHELTVEAMELCGLYTGDGSGDVGNRVEIAHGVGDPHVPYYMESVRREFGVEPYTDKRGTRSRFSSREFRSLLDCGFIGSAHTKRVPGWVFRLTEDLRLGFLRGYLDADGGIARGVISFASCNPELLEDIRHLCISVGVAAGRVHFNRPGGVGYIKGRAHMSRPKYVLNLSMTAQNPKIGSNHAGKAANLRTEPMQRVLRGAPGWKGGLGDAKAGHRPETTPGGTWAHPNVMLQRVVSIDQGTVEVPVYDIAVSDHEHFIADGVIVHNSGLEQQMLGFINVDLHPTWLGPTEQRITKELLGKDLEARYDMRDIMRGDSVARANYYQVMFGLGGLNANEIRFDEDLPPVEGGDEYLKPTVEVPVGPTPVIGGSAVSDSPQT